MIDPLRDRLPVTLVLWLLVSAAALADGRLTGKVVSVADGDSITVLSRGERHRIRLRDIDAPERGQPVGADSRRALVTKVLDRHVRIEGDQRDQYQRRLGVVWLGSRDINREMVREGHAWAYRRYIEADDPLLGDEASARAARVGVWAVAEPVAPWAWRRGERAPHADAR
jgi:endonuclease YncB( thermonuclease family)